MDCTRRMFLTAASGVALGTRLAASPVQGANNRIRVGIIGTGGRARGLMNQLKPICRRRDVGDLRRLRAAPAAGRGDRRHRPRCKPPTTGASSTTARSTPC